MSLLLQLALARRAPSTICTACRYRGYATKEGSGVAKQKHNIPQPKSSCPADTVLIGLNYLKGQEPVLAKPDEDYPEWLWTILRPKVIEDDGPGGKFERMERRRANKQGIKERNFLLTQ
ncbi:likely mitochondrial ribosome protein mrpl37p [Moniliophthora roreri MCA 2997]|uniref:Large ribosomal subunit protein mL54 n=1 Tax=Moniliophthora roreri (strain MCA 2997) TaxID=1381753 RepID=V2X6P5_MONRO|nr:likely mitochondrial ribosome protein mrpl37p [Moniliophthora roreri MCA 2997]KAI3619632.1 putative mitochondrial ribosome protein mrpl37p [Moniliophthora roreri]